MSLRASDMKGAGEQCTLALFQDSYKIEVLSRGSTDSDAAQGQSCTFPLSPAAREGASLMDGCRPLATFRCDSTGWLAG